MSRQARRLNNTTEQARVFGECLTRVAYKPSIIAEQATSSYSFRSPELSQSI